MVAVVVVVVVAVAAVAVIAMGRIGGDTGIMGTGWETEAGRDPSLEPPRYSGPEADMLRDEHRRYASGTFGGRGSIFQDWTAADPTLSTINPTLRGALDRLKYSSSANYLLNAMRPNSGAGNFRDYLAESGLSGIGDLDFKPFLNAFRNSGIDEDTSFASGPFGAIAETLRGDPATAQNFMHLINRQKVATPFQGGAGRLVDRALSGARDQFPGITPFEYAQRKGWSMF